MAESPTVADLFRTAANRLRVDFEGFRQTNFHNAGTGAEIEGVLRKFLDAHLPRRFESTSAILIDAENNVSKQTDIAVYDALNSPVYRTSDIQQILPIDHVAAVIEVKTSLNKAELTDAYAKIASCKALKKQQLTDTDKSLIGAQLRAVGTLGIVFAFDSNTSMETLAENAKELNEQYNSDLWPDLIVVFDKGVIAYSMQLPHEQKLVGVAMPPATSDFVVPPMYHVLCYIEDGPLALNRFFILLLSALTFFPHRPSTMPFQQMLGSTTHETHPVIGYQYDTKRKLHVVPPEEDGKKRGPSMEFRVLGPDGKQVAQLSYFPWQDGGFVVGFGIPLFPLVQVLMRGAKFYTTPTPDGAEYTSLLELTREQFQQWPEQLAATGSSVRLEHFPPM